MSYIFFLFYLHFFHIILFSISLPMSSGMHLCFYLGKSIKSICAVQHMQNTWASLDLSRMCRSILNTSFLIMREPIRIFIKHKFNQTNMHSDKPVMSQRLPYIYTNILKTHLHSHIPLFRANPMWKNKFTPVKYNGRAVGGALSFLFFF